MRRIRSGPIKDGGKRASDQTKKRGCDRNDARWRITRQIHEKSDPSQGKSWSGFFLARPQALSSIREPVIGGLNDYYISHMNNNKNLAL